MTSPDVGGVSLQLNDDGYLQDFDAWDEQVARALAELAGVCELTEEHWKIITYLREYYQEFGTAPLIRKLCKATGVSMRRLLELFPTGPAKGACKVAGLPRPVGCM